MKKGLLLLPLLALFTSACSSEFLYDPRIPYPGKEGGESSGELGEFDLTVYFYLDYSHSDTPIYEMKWYQLQPLGECPKEALLDDSKAADPLYPKFLGYSEYSSAIDEDLIWNFATDFKQGNPLKLYGIWVSV